MVVDIKDPWAFVDPAWRPGGEISQQRLAKAATDAASAATGADKLRHLVNATAYRRPEVVSQNQLLRAAQDAESYLLVPPEPGMDLTELMMKGPETMVTPISSPQNIDATRAGAIAIEEAYHVRKTMGRLMELAAQVGPVTQRASLLKLEISGIVTDLATIESRHMAVVTEVKGEDGKKLYGNKESREAACAKAVSEDANAQVLAASLNDKRIELASAEAAEKAITTEIGALKAVAKLAGDLLSALGAAAA